MRLLYILIFLFVGGHLFGEIEIRKNFLVGKIERAFGQIANNQLAEE
jgi:hypothetical protein